MQRLKRRMRGGRVAEAFAAGVLLAAGSAAAGEEVGDTAYEEARRIVADLGRIVTPNGVQETFKARIGGIDQWFSVRGKDRDNPLLLFVHGGPASPAMPTAWAFQRPWEEFFTVVQWDQRAAGKTYRANDPEEVAPTIGIERFVADTLEATDYLRERYGKRRIILLGHSWGSIVGLRAALRHPEAVHAYVGIGQVISVRENERLGYAYALETAREQDNREAIRELEEIAPYPGTEPLTRERIGMQRKWAQHYGGLSAWRNESRYYYDLPKLSPAYSAEDRSAINEGSLLTLGRILEEWYEVDFRDVTQVPFPVLMLMGRHDYTTPSAPAAQWMDRLEAPEKKAVWFEHSSHLLHLEEPGKVLLTLVDFLRLE